MNFFVISTVLKHNFSNVEVNFTGIERRIFFKQNGRKERRWLYRLCRTLNQGLKAVVAAIHCLTSRRFVKPSKIDPQNVQQNMTNDQLNLPRPFKEVQKWPLNSFFIISLCHQTEGNPNASGSFSNMSLRPKCSETLPFAPILPPSSGRLSLP